MTDSAWDLRSDLEGIRDDCEEFDMPDEADDLDVILAEATEQDSMGLSYVFYWPWISVEEEA